MFLKSCEEGHQCERFSGLQTSVLLLTRSACTTSPTHFQSEFSSCCEMIQKKNASSSSYSEGPGPDLMSSWPVTAVFSSSRLKLLEPFVWFLRVHVASSATVQSAKSRASQLVVRWAVSKDPRLGAFGRSTRLTRLTRRKQKNWLPTVTRRASRGRAARRGLSPLPSAGLQVCSPSIPRDSSCLPARAALMRPDI